MGLLNQVYDISVTVFMASVAIFTVLFLSCFVTNIIHAVQSGKEMPSNLFQPFDPRQILQEGTTAYVWSADDRKAHWCYYKHGGWHINSLVPKNHVTHWQKPDYLKQEGEA